MPVVSLVRSRPRAEVGAYTRAFWVTAAAFAVVMAFGTAPTPLWPLFAARDRLGPTMVTVAFAAIVVGTATGFLLLGHLSDRHGRRVVIVPALLVTTGSAVLFVVWHGLPALIVARALNGVGTGLMAATATTYLSDLFHRAHPDRPLSPVPGVVAASANLGGLALGPLVAGVLGAWAPRPLATTFVVFAVTMTALAVVLLLDAPETVTGSERTPRRFGLRPGAGAVFAGATGMGAFAFAVMGFFSALSAVMLRGELGASSVFAGGMPGFILFAASAVVQLAAGGWSETRMSGFGVVLFPAGLALTVLSLYRPSLAVFLVAAAVTGAGAGLLFKAALAEAAGAARPESRAGVLAVFFAVAYVGTGLPSVAFTVAQRNFGFHASMLWFAVLLSVGAVAAVAIARRR
ncbi:MFS transporter [Actinomadura harenae]|uniref:MFS transporter n=1 Tax=Actinomadura harenae TaxID=2483351 RepID=A0A3M2M8I8_9ACTN|nr:MFS transporter [Actinomadura harenae]RMI45926.1 MFS transporter [Actinomadura harenae]